jgi:hypothetical protein
MDKGMSDEDYQKRLDFQFVGAGLIADNEPAQNLIDQMVMGQIVSFNEITERDLKFHRAYMGLLNYIWSYMPDKFKRAVPKQYFYRFVKHLKRKYEIVYSFKNETRKQEIRDYLKLHKKEFRLSKKSIEAIAKEFGITDMIEYVSISFGRMSEVQFHSYVKDQLPFIYTDIIRPMFDEETYEAIIENIENEFQKFFNKL